MYILMATKGAFMADWQSIYEQTKNWTIEAGELIKQLMTSQITVETKSSAKDLVTNIDREIEQFLTNKIKQIYPEHVIIGEESEGHHVADMNGVVWIIDPIDGTTNFIQQKRNFAISIGIYENGIGKIGVIYDVMNDELYHCLQGNGSFCNATPLPPLKPVTIEESLVAINLSWLMKNPIASPDVMKKFIRKARGARSLGSATIQLAHVCAGILDAYITMNLNPWDFAAGKILLEEVGGTIHTFHGEEINLLGRNSIFAAKPGYQQQFIKQYL